MNTAMALIQQVQAVYLNSQLELQQLDQEILRLYRKRGYLETDELSQWISYHFGMWTLYQLICVKSVLIPKNYDVFMKRYANESTFENVMVYAKAHELPEAVFDKLYMEVHAALAQSGTLGRVTIESTHDGWLIKNTQQWNQAYIEIWYLMNGQRKDLK